MLDWLQQLWRSRSVRQAPAIPDSLWQATLAAYPFLNLPDPDQAVRLRALSRQFLASKEFTGAHGLEVTDEMALAIAAQACLPVLHLGLAWYDDFKGIVVHPGAMLARREVTDEIGLVHGYEEELTGEAMELGPVTLSWQDVAQAGQTAPEGYNVVIHEFAHKLDMRDGTADGCPPLPPGPLRASWQNVMQAAYDQLREQIIRAERFGGEAPWLDAYGATAPAEFFAVSCEAYFVNRAKLAQDFEELTDLFDQFFRRSA